MSTRASRCATERLRRALRRIAVASSFLVACQAAPDDARLCARDSDCPASLTCALGRCRAGCRTSDDCPARARCLVDPRSDARVCSLDLDSCATHDCPLGFACRDDQCLNACDLASVCPDGVCTDGACVPVRGDAGVPVGDAGSDASVDAGCLGATCPQVVHLGAGEGHVCAIRADGSLWCWGHSDQAQLGDRLVAHGSCADCSPVPVQALGPGGTSPLAGVTDVNGGIDSTCAVSGGSAACWGMQLFGLDPVPFASATGVLTDVREVDETTNAVCVRVGTAGEVWCAGEGGAGQLGDGTHNPSTVAVRATQLGPDAVELALSYNHSMVRVVDGTIRGVGNNTAWELGRADDTDQVIAVVPPFPAADALATCATHSCGIFAAGADLGCWGVTGPLLGPGAMGLPCGQGTCSATLHLLPRPTGFVLEGLAMAVHSVCAWTTMGDVYCAGDVPILPGVSEMLVRVPGISHVEQIVATDTAMCARTTEGEVWCWGSQQWGQLGDGVVSAAGASFTPLRVTFP